MMFSMRSPVIRLAMLAVAMLCVIAAGEANKQAKLDNMDLNDLLDADQDEAFPHKRQHRVRNLQATFTAAPTPAPYADSYADKALESAAPTAIPDVSAASSWRSSASVASALAFVGTVAAAAAAVVA